MITTYDTHFRSQVEKPFLYRVMFGGGGTKGEDAGAEDAGAKGEEGDKGAGDKGEEGAEGAGDKGKEATPAQNPGTSGMSAEDITDTMERQEIIAPEKSKLVSSSLYFSKINTLFLVFFLALLLSLLSIQQPLFIRLAFKTKNPDFAATQDFKTKWSSIMKYTGYFILLIILFHVMIANLVMICYVIYAWYHYHWNKRNPKLELWKYGKKKMTEMFWEYYDDSGMQQGLISYYVMMFLAIIIMYIFYLVYMYIVKDYVNDMYYQTVDGKKDITQPRKYAYQYCTYMIIMMLFIMLLLNYDKTLLTPIVLVYNIFFIMVYVFLTILLVRLMMQRNTKIFFVVFFIFLITFRYYKAPIRAIAKYMG